MLCHSVEIRLWGSNVCVLVGDGGYYRTTLTLLNFIFLIFKEPGKATFIKSLSETKEQNEHNEIKYMTIVYKL